MATCDVNALMAAGTCYTCLEPKQARAVQLQLLCELQDAISDLISAMVPAPTAETLAYAADTVLDFNGADYQTVTLAGDIDFSASVNRAAVRVIVVRVIADGSQRTLSFNASWRFVGAKPTTIAANKVGILSLTSFSTDEANVVAAWAVES